MLSSPVKHWLASREWYDDYDQTTLSRGKGYASVPPISNLEISATGRSFSNVRAEVKGTRRNPYHVDIEIYDIKSSSASAAECSCPVGEQCKHSAAVLEYLSQELTSAAQPSQRVDKLSA